MRDGFLVVLGQARLRGPSSGGDRNVDRLLIEAQISPSLVCLGIAVLPEMPLLERLLKEILVERPWSEFGEACKEIEVRYHGPYARAVLAALRSLTATTLSQSGKVRTA